MRNQFKKPQQESQIEWKHTNHEGTFNPMQRFYGVIKVGEKNYLTEYESKFRSEVVALFQEESRLMGGTLEVIGVYKK